MRKDMIEMRKRHDAEMRMKNAHIDQIELELRAIHCTLEVYEKASRHEATWLREPDDSLLRAIRARAEDNYHEAALNDVRDLLDKIESLHQVIALAYGFLWHLDLVKTGQDARHALRDVLTPLRRELGINDAKKLLTAN
jgi:hypothetical protein